MKKHLYPLQAALKLREIQVEQAELRLVDAIAAVEAAKKKVEAAKREVDDHKHETKKAIEKDREDKEARIPERMRMFQHYLKVRKEEEDLLKKTVKVAEDKQAKLEKEEAAARMRLAYAEAELKAVEKHHERWKQERRKELEEKHDQELEDVANSRRR